MPSLTLEERVQLLEDKEAIARIKARYCNINDGGWAGVPTHHANEELVNMFTADGIWDGGPIIGARAEGQAQIRALFEHFKAVDFVIHNVMNPLIDVSGDTAHGEWHAIIASTMGHGKDRKALWTFGKYNEDYVRTAEGWKIKKLVFTVCACSPYESGWGDVQFIGQ